MAFTQVPVSGNVVLSNSTPANGAVVTFTLNTPITDGTQIVAPEAVSATCNSSGAFSVTLNANDDTTTQPTGTYYKVLITYGSQTLDSFNVIVPHADSSGVNLFTLAQLTNPNTLSPYVSQVFAGAGINLSPVGGTGSVTISSSGGVATGQLLFTRPGTLAVEAEALRLPITTAYSIISVTAVVNTAPTGASIIVDVLKNGSTIWSVNPGNRPTIAASTNSSGPATPDLTALSVGDYLQLSIVQVGSTIPGADLTVALLVH